MARGVLHSRMGFFLCALCVGAASPALAATPTVTAGFEHSLALKADGTLRAWGNDGSGELGLGRPLMRATAATVPDVSPAAAIAAGERHTLVLRTDGSVWAWGQNNAGQLGDTTTIDRSLPGPVPGVASITALAAGYRHSVALANDGRVWAWGLGFTWTPRAIDGLTDVTAIAAGSGMTLALRSDGTVWTWGQNHHGQLGDGTTDARGAPAAVAGLAQVVAISAGESFSVALKADGTVWVWGLAALGGDGTVTRQLRPAQVQGLTGVTKISAGGFRGHALKADGTVWRWDYASTVAARIEALSGVKEIFAGGQHEFALLGDGRVLARGGGDRGELCNGSVLPLDWAVVEALAGAVSIAGGGFHTVALRADGTVATCGWNTHGQLGDAAVTFRSTPLEVSGAGGIRAVRAARSFSVALKDDGTLLSWGWNDYGQLGAGVFSDGRSSPGAVIGIAGVVAISTGSEHVLALTGDGSVWSWGYNSKGELGDGTTQRRNEPRRVDGLSGVVAIAAGYTFSLALKADGTVWAWGSNETGQLGDGSTIARHVPGAVSGLGGVTAIAAGGYHAFAVKAGGELWGWGNNNAGELGDGTFTNRLVPGVLPFAGVAAISAGAFHTIALKLDGTVWGWGNNTWGQTGSATLQRQPTAAVIDGLANVAAVSAGAFHSLAVTSDGSVFAWGANQYSQLGDGSYVPRTAPVVVLAEQGAGHLDTNDWFLDLDPASPSTIPPAFTPKMLAVSQLVGSGSRANLDSKAKYKTAEFGKPVRNYVLGLVPPEFFDQVKTAPGAKTSAELRAKSGGALVLAQLTPLGWTNAQGQLIAYSQATANAAGGAASILNGVNASLIPGARFCIGYGESAAAMLSSETLREVLVFEGATATVSDMPCVLSGVYVDGPSTSRLASPVTFNAAVVGLSPSGSVQFRDGLAALLAPATLVAANQAVARASLTTSTLALGVHSIGAAYSGDAQNAAAREAIPLRHEVVNLATGSRVELAGPASSAAGDEIVFTATVSGDRPTGTVQLKDGGADLGAPQAVIDGVAAFRVSSLGLGAHAIGAAYSGDAANAAATSTVVPHTVYDALRTGVALATSANPSAFGAPVTLTATVSGSAPTGSVTFRSGATALATSAVAAGTASAIVVGLTPGLHALSADYGGDAANQAASSATLMQMVLAQASGTAPRAFGFAPRSNVAPGAWLTSNAVTIGGLDTAVPVIVAGGSYSIGCGETFTTAAGMISDGQAVCVRHRASDAFDTATLTALTIGGVSASFESRTHAANFGASVAALVAHYYRSVLRREPDGGGQAFWETEVARAGALGASVNEAFLAMAEQFFFGSEYASFARDDAAFISDAYTTFFDRPADASGLAYWASQVGSGLTREVVLASFMFSPEFGAFMRQRLGAAAARAEVDTVMDFYRGLLTRLPDDSGFDFWMRQFRAAQCEGAPAVYRAVEAISSAFIGSAEYSGRGRTNAQYVSDLYKTFLRRGGDVAGFQFWVGQLDGGARTRDRLRQDFLASPEFSARVDALIAQGCLG